MSQATKYEMLSERSEFIECFEKIGFRPLSQDVFAPFFLILYLSVTKEKEYPCIIAAPYQGALNLCDKEKNRSFGSFQKEHLSVTKEKERSC